MPWRRDRMYDSCIHNILYGIYIYILIIICVFVFFYQSDVQKEPHRQWRVSPLLDDKLITAVRIPPRLRPAPPWSHQKHMIFTWRHRCAKCRDWIPQGRDGQNLSPQKLQRNNCWILFPGRKLHDLSFLLLETVCLSCGSLFFGIKKLCWIPRQGILLLHEPICLRNQQNCEG